MLYDGPSCVFVVYVKIGTGKEKKILTKSLSYMYNSNVWGFPI